ncbi:MAG: hypothetical protein RLY20_3339 [Verrucomicrobiota bacterium]|jgi:hypothetical protein
MISHTPPKSRNFTALPKIELLCLAALTASVVTSLAADIVNDTWKDATWNDPVQPRYSETGTDLDADGNIESSWMLSNGGSMAANPFSPGNSMLVTPVPSGSCGMTTYFTSNSAVNLSGVGDKLKITWSFIPRVPATNGNSSQNFRVAVVDWPESVLSRMTATNQQPGSATYAGYAVFMNMATNLAGSGAFQLKNRTAPATTNDFLGTSGNWATLAADATASGTKGYEDGTNYTFVFQFTRINSTDLEIVASMTGGTIGGDGELKVTYTNAPAQTFSFDTFGMRPSSAIGAAEAFSNTLFRVEYTASGCVPVSFNVTGTTTNCSGGTSAIGLSGSESGASYQLYQGASPVGSPVTGTGSALSFGSSFSAGTYTVVASNLSGCIGSMAGSAVLSEYLNPSISVQPSPTDATNGVGTVRTFSVTATSSAIAYQWRKNGTNLSNGGNISGAKTNTLVLSGLTLGDSGSYDCLVSNTICQTEAVSSPANLTVIQVFGPLFRSIASGDWATLSTWELSTNGTTWFPATEAPSTLSSNITLQTGHTVNVNADVTVDQLTIQSGATVSVQAGNFTLNNGIEAVDCDVSGTLEVGAGAGVIDVGAATLRFSSGGQFNWNRAAAPAVPTATWQDGSTCRITQINTGSSALATGIGGQSYYDFIYDTTAGGQVASARCRMNITNNTTVRRDFTIKVADATSASVTILNAANTVLTVGRDVTFQTQTNSGNGNKVLLANASLTGLGIKIGRNFNSSGYLDGFGGASTLLEFNGTGTQSLDLTPQPFIITSSAMNWVVDSGSSVQLANNIDGFSTFTNNGTLSLNNYKIVRGSALVLNSGSTLVGSGTNQLTFTNYVSSLNVTSSFDTVTYGGTLSLPGLPAFVGGESFLLFQAAARSGSFSAISPATPGAGLVWNTNLLVSDGILSVATGGGGPATNPTNITSLVSGGNLTLGWPSDHLGWTLQTQTNNRNVGLVAATNAWFDVPGSTTVTNFVIPISPAQPTVFFRLKL